MTENKLPVNEYFHTMQGEAFYTGKPSFFIRLQGCDVGCHFCDTKYTWSFRSKNVSLADLKPESPQFAWATAEELIQLAKPSPHVVITGGEPCLHDLTQLTKAIIDNDMSVQIETSATAHINAHPDTWITLSPKLFNPNGKPILKEAVDRANEFKFPVETKNDVKIIEDFFKEHSQHDREVWLQPISQGEEATDICLEAARLKGWRVSVQTHKYIGLR